MALSLIMVRWDFNYLDNRTKYRWISFIRIVSKRFDLSDSIHKNINLNSREVILFNSLARQRMETICVHVNDLNTIVVLASKPNASVLQQIGPILEFVNKKWVIDSKLFEV